MSGIHLATPFLDTGSDDLSFALGLPAHEALAVAEVETSPGLTVELRLLGASHQVFAGPVRETVACLPGGSPRLPARVTEKFPGWLYRFAAEVEQHDPVGFAHRVTAVRTAVEGRSDALYGVFPGAADAVTALAVERGPGLGWRTWHTYPQTGHVVATHTRMEIR
ncbi:DUF2617 family protein [Streptomyces sp. TR06-5]|uniref:DUF2617 family protein n=1 Tax=Streptomyces sp. TR06-5 TaxID=3385976 RepID=UPI0039A389E9